MMTWDEAEALVDMNEVFTMSVTKFVQRNPGLDLSEDMTRCMAIGSTTMLVYLDRHGLLKHPQDDNSQN